MLCSILLNFSGSFNCLVYRIYTHIFFIWLSMITWCKKFLKTRSMIHLFPKQKVMMMVNQLVSETCLTEKSHALCSQQSLAFDFVLRKINHDFGAGDMTKLPIYSLHF